MPITLKQLSELAGVHPSTVARVLQNDPRQRVSAEVRERIQTLAREYNYRPNTIARSLRTKRSTVVGALIPDIANPIFATAFRSMEDAVAERDYGIILANTDDSPEREARSLAMLRDRQVDGLLLATARRTDEAIAQLQAERVPFVLVNRHTDPIPPNAVVPDDYTGAVAAVAHLLTLGHTRIAHIAGNTAVSTAYLRRQGYLDTMRQHVPSIGAALVMQGSFREAGGYAAMQELLHAPEPPTAVFAVNDLAALGAINAIREAGLRVPEDISVVGFNDLFPASHMSPQLTTIQLPTKLMGTRSAEMLLDMLIEGVQPAQPLFLPTTLVVRESTAPVQTLPRTRSRPPHKQSSVPPA